MQSINKNYDSGQHSLLFFQGKEYKLINLRTLDSKGLEPASNFILELDNDEFEIGKSRNSSGLLIDFETYRDHMTYCSGSSKLLFLKIKKKTELQIWKSELCHSPNIFPVVNEYNTDWIKSILIEKTPVLFEVSQEMKFPTFVSGYIYRKNSSKSHPEVDHLREQLRMNQLVILNSLAERRRIIEDLKELKSKKGLDVYQSDIFFKNLLFSYEDAKSNNLPLNDVMDLYLFLHEISIKQQAPMFL